MMKHCWEIEDCGREPGGKNADKLGICSAAVYALDHEAYVEIAEVMIAAINRNGDIVFINRKGYEILGYEIGTLEGKNWFKLLMPEAIFDRMYLLFRKIITSKRQVPEYFENELVRKDGKEVLISFHNTVIKDHNGEISGILFSGEDITTKRQTENQLIENKKKLDAIIGSALDAIIMIDSEGNIELWNEAAEMMFGYDKKEAEGKALVETIIPAKYRQKAKLGLFRFTRNNEKEFKGHIKEAEAVRKNGTLFPVEISVSMVILDSSRHAVAIIRDITERKAADRIIRESEKMFRIISEKSSIASYIIQDNLFRYVNPAFEKLTGYSASEIIDKLNLFQIILEDEGRLKKGMENLLSGKASKIKYDAKAMRKDGKVVFLEIQADVTRFKGRSAIVGTAVDITDKIGRENELLRKLSDTQKQAQQLNKLAYIDALTGIYNRRMFNEIFKSKWNNAKRKKEPLSLLMIDIDLFKGYNDRYGHQAGDRCLIRVSRAIKDSLFRSSDSVSRYGGEEFVVILPDTKINGALMIANRIRNNIENLHIAYKDCKISSYVTVSVGVACVVPDRVVSDRAELIKMADMALYKAKNEGRNRISVKG